MIQDNHESGEQDDADGRRCREPGGEQGQRGGHTAADDQRRQRHAEQAFSDNKTGGNQHSLLFHCVRVRRPVGASLEPLRDDGADHHRQAGGHGQVDADADAQGRQAHEFPSGEDFVQDNHYNTDRRAGAEHVPVEAVAEYASCQGRDEDGLGCGQGLVAGDRRGRGLAGEAIGVGQEIQDGRDDNGAGDDADDEGGLLRPR